MSQVSESQPGYTIFKFSENDYIPKDLRMIFLPMEQTYGQPVYPLDSDPYVFRVFDFRRFGLNDLTV
jgi:hypothetical protein